MRCCNSEGENVCAFTSIITVISGLLVNVQTSCQGEGRKHIHHSTAQWTSMVESWIHAVQSVFSLKTISAIRVNIGLISNEGSWTLIFTSSYHKTVSWNIFSSFFLFTYFPSPLIWFPYLNSSPALPACAYWSGQKCFPNSLAGLHKDTQAILFWRTGSLKDDKNSFFIFCA